MTNSDIQGTIVDSSGTAVENAVVEVTPATTDASLSEKDVVRTTTDSNGKYIVEKHPAGDGTSQEWHVSAYNWDGSTWYNALNKPGVTASLAPAIPDSVVEDFEDGDTSGWTLNGDNDGTNYFFQTQTNDIFEGSFSGEQHLKGLGGSAVYTETKVVSPEINNPSVEFSFQLNAFTDGNPDYHAQSELKVSVTLDDSSSETITYRMATVDASPSDNASSLFFVVSGHNSSSWSTFTRNINDDLSSGGYANVNSIDAFKLKIITPGTGGGTDEIHMYYDSLVIRNE